MFSSKTKAFREVLLGCILARISNKTTDISLPYTKQGESAFNGRSLDEKVINPFLQSRRIPCSKGPYLSVFRRDARFDDSFLSRVRDQDGYREFLNIIDVIKHTSSNKDLRQILNYLLYKFILLREDSEIPLARLRRLSLNQYDKLISGLLTVRSGGIYPVLLVHATFMALIKYFDLDWEIISQGINVADAVSGAGGDITIRSGRDVIFAAEITERKVDLSRVIATFNTKIAPAGYEDYLFFIKDSEVNSEILAHTQHFFSQGHEINFLEIKNWIIMILATIGKDGRDYFNKSLLDLMDTPDISKSLRVGWNEQISRLSNIES